MKHAELVEAVSTLQQQVVALTECVNALTIVVTEQKPSRFRHFTFPKVTLPKLGLEFKAVKFPLPVIR